MGLNEFILFNKKKNKKEIIFTLKLKAMVKQLSELEKNEKIDKNLLRYLTIRVKKLDLETNYFDKNNEDKNLKKF